MRIEVTKLGRKMQKRRELLGLLQTQLAALSGISARTIQLVEQGKGNPSLDTLLKLAEPLGLEVDLVLVDLVMKEPIKTVNP